MFRRGYYTGSLKELRDTVRVPSMVPVRDTTRVPSIRGVLESVGRLGHRVFCLRGVELRVRGSGFGVEGLGM